MEKLATCLLSLITQFHANFPQSSTIGRLLLWYIFPRESLRALLPPKLCNTRSTRISQQHRTFRFVFSIRAHSILSFHTNFPTRFQRATIFPWKKRKTTGRTWSFRRSQQATTTLWCVGEKLAYDIFSTRRKSSHWQSKQEGQAVWVIRWHFEWISNIVSEWI